MILIISAQINGVKTDGEFNQAFMYIWNQKTNSWEKHVRDGNGNKVMQILTTAAITVAVALAIGVIVFLVVRANFIGGGGNGECNIASPTPSHSICPR